MFRLFTVCFFLPLRRPHRDGNGPAWAGGRVWRWLAGWFAVALFGCGSALRAVDLPRGVARQSVATWMSEQGLPQDTVTAVLASRDGYLWVGTEAGLARFDGLRFVTYRTTNTAAFLSHAVRALWEDAEGNLWIGTDDGVVRRTADGFVHAGLAGREVSGLCADGEGGLWAATDDGVFIRRSAGFERLPADPAVPRSAPRGLFADRAGRVWIGFADWPGVVCVDHGRPRAFDANGSLRDEVLCGVQTADGGLWFGTSHGVVQWHEDPARRIGPVAGVPRDPVTCLQVDDTGVLWVAGRGLQRISGGEIATIAEVAPLGSTRVNSLCQDREGNVWIGSTEEGLLRVDQPAWQLIGLDARGVDTGFRTVMQGPDGDVWLAQGGKGVVRVDVSGELVHPTFAHRGELDDVLGVYVLPSGEVFVGTRGALQIWRGDAVETHPELTDARAFFRARDGTLWIGMRDKGIVTWRDGIFTPVALPERARGCTPASFAERSDGRMYVGTWMHGLLIVGPDEVTVWNQETGAPTNDVRLVYVDRGDAVWIGAVGYGLGLWEDGRLLFADWTSALIDPRINSVIEDDRENLWIASSRRVFTAPRAELLAALRNQIAPKRLRLADVTEGIRGTIDNLDCFPSVCQTRAGQLWYATRTGILTVDGAKIVPNRHPPVVKIERVLAGGREVDAGGELALPAGTSGLLIEYVGISLSAPNRVRFQYRLRGIDPDWVDAGERRVASYASLPPGHYEFQVIACNADGVWNDAGAVLRFEQRAYFYQQGWFYALLAVGLVVTGLSLSRWRVAALHREKQKLEVAIGERTRELQAAKELAEASTRAKSEFLQSISHEIRNPLNGVMGLTEMLRDAPADARQEELLVSLRACSKSLGRVFDEVLSFTRLEHGHVALHETPFSLTELLADVVALFRVAVRDERAPITLEIDPDTPDRLVGDGEKIQAVLENFLSNAVRHAPGSPIDVVVSADSVNDYGASVTVAVTDHGPGIAFAEQELVFEKFVRGSTARTQRVGGTGLGLATSRALAELMGGHVGVDSEPGQGASFFLTVRLKRDRGGRPDQPAAAARPAPVAQRALVVEDQAYNQIVVRQIAETLGYATDVASDAGEALARLAEQDYALILLDWELPDMTGEDVAHIIRARPAAAASVLIATTAHDSEDIRRRCVAAGFDDFVLKPLNTEAIARCIEQVRQRRAGADQRLALLDTRVFRLVGRTRPDGVQLAIAQYVEILGQELAGLHEAIAHDDRVTIVRTAHRLKAHAGLVHATALRAAAADLEREAPQATADQLTGLEREIGELAEQVRAELSRPPRSAGGE